MMNLESRKAGKELAQSDLTQGIIVAAIRVHTELGPGFLESVYEEALALEFTGRGVPFERQKVVPILYGEHHVGEHRLDFIVSRSIVVELKAISEIADIHFAIARSYLKAAGLHDGLLLNFATCPLTIKRVTRERRPINKQILV